MIALELFDIHKTYRSAMEVRALRGVSFSFRRSEFVCVLGPSGCGKTTLLNIIGGLDRYDEGDLVIGGVSTKAYTDADWDAYRNRSVGFVFQNYNLIPHQSVLKNVEIALTLSGVSPGERRKRAEQALVDVGLHDQLSKKPSQLSGGQMQRVAIARALVNDPEIILADEPTGSLDSQTSVQVMEILSEIAKTRLVIMVTHNAELADKYATRTIHLLDGETLSDDNPADQQGARGRGGGAQGAKTAGTAMSLGTAVSLSFSNLLTKRVRAVITAFAGSIGIIGIALVLAITSGVGRYIGDLQAEVLSGFPISITAGPQTLDDLRDPANHVRPMQGPVTRTAERFPGDDLIRRRPPPERRTAHTNVFTPEYIELINSLKSDMPGAISTVSFDWGVEMNVLAGAGGNVVRFETVPQGFMGGMMDIAGMPGMLGGPNLYWMEMPDNEDFILSQFELIGGEGSRLPRAANEVAIVVDTFNRLSAEFMSRIGIDEGEIFAISDFLGQNMLKVVPNNYFYTPRGDLFTAATMADFATIFDSDVGKHLTVVGILRMRPGVSNGFLSPGFVHTVALTDYIVQNAAASDIVAAQLASPRNVLTGMIFSSEALRGRQLARLGGDPMPMGINIFPRDFAAKEAIALRLDEHNDALAAAGRADERIIFVDMAELISDMTQTLLSTVSYALIFFAAISLFVSTIMIGIITYVSVLERTKEIGILRSVGARKKDITRVFKAETLIIGLAAGVIGVGIAYVLQFPINMIIVFLAGIDDIAALRALHALLLVAGSMCLTLLSGLIPSRIAARKDPVEALRVE